MSLIPTDLYGLLDAKCSQMRPGPVDGRALLAMVNDATKVLADLLNRTCRIFGDFTFHDENHAVRVVHLMHRLIGDETSSQLHEIDLALLILAAYAHDVGMLAEKEERARILESDDFTRFTTRYESRWAEAQRAPERRRHEGLEALREQIFQDYLRERHHLRSAAMVLGPLAHLFEVSGLSLASPVASLASSHGEPVSAISRLRVFSFATVYGCDLPFLACVLRLADLLDLDPARAPRALVDIMRPGGKRSLNEWRKQQSNFAVSDTAIEFHARLSNFFEEKALRDTLRELECERQECMELLAARAPDSRRLKLARPVEIHIEPDGYIYEEFRFQLEYEQIMSLLMGTQLYRDERAFVRELLQNAIDACRHARAAAAPAEKGGPLATIHVRRFVSDSNQQIIEVSDEGSGMTREIVRDYFMRVGRSFYQSFAFRRRQLQMEPIAQFGIGILSCFMMSRYLEVQTCPDPLVFPPEAGQENRALTLEIRRAQEFFVVRPSDRREPGTTVRVHLTKPLDESLEHIVKQFLARVPFQVKVDDFYAPGGAFENLSFELSGEGFDDAYSAVLNTFSFATLERRFEGAFGFGVHGRIRFFLLSVGNQVRFEWTDVGNYAKLCFTPVGAAVATSKTFTPESQRRFRAAIDRARELTASFPEDVAMDLGNILRNIDRLLSDLLTNTSNDARELQWNSIAAQLNAVSMVGMFQAHPLASLMDRSLGELLQEIKAYLQGQVKLGAPAGILTQDGLNLFGIEDFTTKLGLGLGYIYNIDLCGSERFALSASRDSVVWDETSDRVCAYLQGEIGGWLGNWFRELSLADEDVWKYAKSVPKPLREAVLSAYVRHDRA